MGMTIKTVKRVEKNSEDWECCLEYTSVKENLIECKCLCFNRNYLKRFNENLKITFSNTYKFSTHDINTLFLCCKKSAYPYKNTDDWKKVNEV